MTRSLNSSSTTKLGFKTKGGFKSFVRRRDGKPPVPKTVSLEITEVADVVLSYLREVLEGRHRSLINAFTWSSTPQGNYYWDTRDYGDVPLSPEDYQWLQELYDYHANK